MHAITLDGMRHLMTCVALLVVVAACGTTTPLVLDGPASDEKRGLAGHRFEAESALIDGHAVALIDGPGRRGGFLLGFGMEHIYAFGCNEFTSGAWDVRDGKLVTGVDWTSTPRGCDEPRNMQDQWLYDFLVSSPLVARDGDQLVLSTASTVITLRDVAGENQPIRFF